MKFFNLIQKKAQFKTYIENTLKKKAAKAVSTKRKNMAITEFSQLGDFADNLDSMNDDGDFDRDIKVINKLLKQFSPSAKIAIKGNGDYKKISKGNATKAFKLPDHGDELKIIESLLFEKKIQIYIDWFDDETTLEKAIKPFRIKIVNRGSEESEIAGDKKEIIKFLKSDDYGADTATIKDIFAANDETV